MFDDVAGDAPVFDFDELANHLLEQGLQSSPAQLHGCLSGLLAAGAAPEPELALAAITEIMELELHGELAQRIMQLYQVTAAALEDEEFDFHPLLPDDEVDIESRAAALGGWCEGFTSGFALVYAGAESAKENSLSKDSTEVLKDFAAIAQAHAGDEDREDEEAAEENYFELVEYIRFATLNVYLDTRAALESKTGDRSEKPTLH